MSVMQQFLISSSGKDASQNEGQTVVDSSNQNEGFVVTEQESLLMGGDYVKLKYPFSGTVGRDEKEEHGSISVKQESEFQLDCKFHSDLSSCAESKIAPPQGVHKSISSVSGNKSKGGSCDVCGKMVSRKQNLNAHVRRQTGEKPFGCNVCGAAFYHRASRTKHEHTHRRVFYKCPICSQKYFSFNALQKHFSVHTDVSCENLTKQTTRTCIAPEETIPLHEITLSGNKQKLPITKTIQSCGNQKKGSVQETAHSSNQSDVSLTINDDLKISDMVKEKCHICSICGQMCKTKGNLKAHSRVHTGNKPHSCDFCDKKFTSMYSLKVHSYIHTGEKPYNCDICGKAFRQLYAMKRHVLIHTVKKQFVCDYCKKKFDSNKLLNEHMLIHESQRSSNEQEKVDGCDVSSTGNSADIAAIMKRIAASCNEKMKKADIITTADKSYMCRICGKRSKTKSHMKAHLRVHTGEKPYKCDICGCNVSSSFSLKIHKYIHTGERPYNCDTCGKSYRHSSTLKNHVLSHTGEKPFVCDFCQKSFKRKMALKEHLITHTGTKPFKCYICEKFFTRKPELNRHIRVHTGGKPNQ